MNHTQEELERLHLCLYDILGEIRRVCDLLNIQFVMLGGSAIGVYYWNGIIPFDDDIDIGMKRDDFERFLKEAPQLLADNFFLQWCGSEKHYPLFFAKVRRNGTLFVEENFRDFDIHQGIYIDILPLDINSLNANVDTYYIEGFIPEEFYLSDENQKRVLRQKILSMKGMLDMLTYGLKSGKIDSEYSLAKCKVDLLDMKQDFEKAFHSCAPKSLER